MDRSNHLLLAELQRLACASDAHGNFDAHLSDLTSATARLLHAERCTYQWQDPENPAGDADLADCANAAAGAVLSAPIRSNGQVIGLLRARGPMGRASFDASDLWLLEMIAVYVGKSLHTRHLQNLLHSRFAQIALAQDVDETVGRVLAAVPQPGRIVRILAKSFYREMTKAGFGTNEIISAASELISELSTSLRRHAKRHEVAP